MPVSPEIDEQIKNRFAQLEELANKLMQEYWEHVEENMRHTLQGDLDFVINLEDNVDYMSGFQRVQLSFLNLLRFLSVDSESFGGLIKDVQSVEPKDIGRLHGMIAALQDDYNQGMLRNIAERVEANLTFDFMQQAEDLFDECKPHEYNHVPAAVLAGALFEKEIRRLCLENVPPIDICNSKGDKLTLDPMITELRKVDKFSKANADLYRYCAKIRNHAAHGEFNEFERSEVEDMIRIIKRFLGEYS